MAIAVIALFATLLVVRGVIDAMEFTSAPVPAGAEGERVRREYENARLSDGSLMRWFEKEARARSAFRKRVSAHYADALHSVFKEVNDEVLAGRDDWLFLRNRIVPLEDPGDQRMLRTAAILGSLSRRLHAIGVDSGLVFIPRKAEIHADQLPKGVDCGQHLYARMLGYLRSFGLNVPDLKAALLSDAATNKYFRQDSHWAPDAQILIAETIGKALQRAVPITSRKTRLSEPVRTSESADLRIYAGLTHGKPSIHPTRVYELRLVEDSMGEPLLPIFGSDPTPTKVTLTGTSFTSDFPFWRYVWHVFDSPVRVDALPAIGPWEPINRSILGACERGQIPEVYIFEVPSYVVFNTMSTPEELGHAIALIPSIGSPIGPLIGADGTEFLQKDSRLLKGTQHLSTEIVRASIPEGRLWHDGRGLIALRIRGRLLRGEVIIRAGSPTVEVHSPWWPTAREIVLPILGTRSESFSSLGLSSRTGIAEVEIESLEVVTDLDLPASDPLALRPGSVAHTSHASFDPPRRIQAKDGLVLFAAPSAKGRDLVLEAGDGKDQVSLRATLPAEGGTVVLALETLLSRTLTWVQVRDVGAPSLKGTDELRLASQRRLR